MQSEELFERLEAADVLVEEVEGEVHRVTVTDAFREAVADARAELDEATVRESGLLDVVARPEDFLALGDRALDFAAVYEALEASTADASEFGPGPLLVLEHLLDDYPRTAGTPEGFLSLRGDQLELALACFDPAALYCWRDDCPTCDSMREVLDGLVAEDGPPVPLLSIFAPDAAATLRGEYDLAGAPTTLFLRGGRVNSRIMGSRHLETVVSELDALAGSD